MQQLEGRINNSITGVRGLTVRDDYEAEARDEHVTELDNVLYIIIALVNIKISYYISKTNEVWNKARGWKKKDTQSLCFSWYRNIRDV